MKWYDCSVSISLPASKSRAFALFSALDEHPTWSPWLHSVQFDRNTGQSTWKLQTLGLTLSWQANNTLVQCPDIIQWESISGLPNRGRVDFSSGGALAPTPTSSAQRPSPSSGDTYPPPPISSSTAADVPVSSSPAVVDTVGTERPVSSSSVEATTMRLTVSYDLPEYAIRAIEALGPAATTFIQETLLGDLQRFKIRLLREIREEKMAEFKKAAASAQSNPGSSSAR